MKLVMTLILRDEADVLEANLRYHFAQGVDFVVATDNASRDGSREILARYEEAGLARVIDEPSDDYRREQAGWYTRMARLAATEFEADWVFNNDADEFWWPAGAPTLREAFASIPEPYAALTAPRPEFVPRPGSGDSFAERLTVRQARSLTGPKVAHRGMEDVVVFYGSHRVGRQADADGVVAARHAGRPALREAAGEDGEDLTVVPAPRWPVRILHFPLRSYAQFEARVRRLVLQEGMELEGRRRELHEHLEAGTLEHVYEEMVADDEAVEAGLAGGRLVRDTRLRDYLPRCADPLEGPVTPVEAAGDPAGRDSDLAALEEDVMRAMARTEHTLLRQRARARERFRDARSQLDRARERQRELERENERLAARVSELEAAAGGGLVARTLGRRR